MVSRGLVVESGPELRARQALRVAERLSRAVVDGLDEGVLVTDADLNAVSWNASALRILGIGPTDAARGARPFGDVRDLCYADGEPMRPQDTPAHRAQERRASVRSTIIHIDPVTCAERWITVLARPIGLIPDAPSAVVCTMADVTDRITAERRLTEERDRAQRYLEVASTLVVVLDANATVELINRQGCELLGFAEGELVGQDWFDAVVPRDERLDARRAFTRLVAEVDPPKESLETFVQTKGGGNRKIAWRNAVLRGPDGLVSSVLRSGEDVTERRRAEAQVAYLAYHDSLTGLPNRAQLEEQLARDIARARRSGGSLALLYFDLDNFKLVNDSLGHEAGDAVLREAAARVSSFVRAGDMLSRQGGDEFLLLLDCSDTDDPCAAAQAAGERIAAVLEEPLDMEGAQFQVGASIGIAIFPEHASDREQLLKHADGAMYQAKRSGGGTFAFYEADAGDARHRLSLTTRLRRAISEDQLLLHYQPIFATDDVEAGPTGYEALVRWDDPEEGMIRPDQFIPVAEESGLIEAIGRWVVDAVCRQAAEWARAGFHPQLSFNLSPRELRKPDLAASIAATIGTYGLDPSQFCAELTETAIVSDSHRHRSLLTELNDIGLTVAIDDFGSGHSSLGRLRELQVQVLKIDRSFLARVPEDPTASAVVAAVLTLSGALGLTSVVEGVESEAQLAFLRAHGATSVQGFLLGRPAPAIIPLAVR